MRDRESGRGVRPYMRVLGETEATKAGMKSILQRGGRASAVAIVASAAALLALSSGLRVVLGLFLDELRLATGLGLAAISLALASSQLLGALAHPLCGALSERFGPRRLVRIGALLLCAGLALLALARGPAMLVLAFGLIAAASAAVGSAPALIAIVGARVGAARRGLATGIVGAGGPFGQLALAPLAQSALIAVGWMQTLLGLAVLALAALPLARPLPASRRAAAQRRAARERPWTLPSAELADSRYWCAAGGFFACGFHVSFLFVHLPGVIARAGLDARLAGTALGVLGFANALGALGAGIAVQRFACNRILATLYASVAVSVTLFVASPKSEAALLVFAFVMGLTCMATVPPTSGLIVRLYGAQRLGTLLGIVMLVHQLGGFAGVWAGGLAAERFGGYQPVWYADIGLMLIAAAVNLALRAAPALTPDPTRTRPASAPADRSALSAPGWRAARSARASSRPSVAPSAAAGSG